MMTLYILGRIQISNLRPWIKHPWTIGVGPSPPWIGDYGSIIRGGHPFIRIRDPRYRNFRGSGCPKIDMFVVFTGLDGLEKLGISY